MFPKDKDGKVETGTADFVETYKAMEECFKKGKAKAIGVSNFSKKEMERLLKETSVVSRSFLPEINTGLTVSRKGSSGSPA